MTPSSIKDAIEWRNVHEEHVADLAAYAGDVKIRPTGCVAIRPELWRGVHWRWLADLENLTEVLWNATADKCNQWGSLGEDEKVVLISKQSYR